MDFEKINEEIKVPKSKRTRRLMKKKEPKLIEGPKNTLIIRGQKTSNIINETLKDLVITKKKNSKKKLKTKYF
jgi:hypothetical protein